MFQETVKQMYESHKRGERVVLMGGRGFGKATMVKDLRQCIKWDCFVEDAEFEEVR